mmetsp:Transcript_4586/g.5182  ORF Transcript_4586/g.5182 Transcript_4586/m.5182 type:complete len:244 (-) Transcript_4586:290-1021(-)
MSNINNRTPAIDESDEANFGLDMITIAVVNTIAIKSFLQYLPKITLAPQLVMESGHLSRSPGSGSDSERLTFMRRPIEVTRSDDFQKRQGGNGYRSADTSLNHSLKGSLQNSPGNSSMSSTRQLMSRSVHQLRPQRVDVMPQTVTEKARHPTNIFTLALPGITLTIALLLIIDYVTLLDNSRQNLWCAVFVLSSALDLSVCELFKNMVQLHKAAVDGRSLDDGRRVNDGVEVGSCRRVLLMLF